MNFLKMKKSLQLIVIFKHDIIKKKKKYFFRFNFNLPFQTNLFMYYKAFYIYIYQSNDNF